MNYEIPRKINTGKNEILTPKSAPLGFFLCEQIADLNHEIIHEILTKSAPWGFFYM
jgi:hypothetical protein